MKQQINTTNAPAAIGPYSQGINTGNLVFVSGQLPLCPITGKLETEITAATKQIFENMRAILAESNLDMNNVVKVTIFMTDLEMFAEMNKIYATYFNEPFPSRSCVQVCRLPKNAIIEAECIATV
ncbi:MAG: RidA family protein [Firmicutes bacterium]|nr:RidA family protein [Bacillota bacterium]